MRRKILINARAVVAYPQVVNAVARAQVHIDVARCRVPTHVVQQGQQGLANPCRVAAQGAALQVQLQGKTSSGQAGFEQPHIVLNPCGEVGVLHVDFQVAAVPQTDHAQILDHPCQPFDLPKQAVELRRVRLEHPLGQALQATAQDGQWRAQFMGNGCIPECLFLCHTFQALGHAVEVIHQNSRLTDGLVAGHGLHIEIAVRQLAQVLGHRVQWHQDAPRQLGGDKCADGQADAGGQAHPRPFGIGRHPLVDLLVRKWPVGPKQGIEHIGADHRQGDHAQHHDRHGQDDLAAQTIE